MHSLTKTLLGTNGSSSREITNEIGDPATFVAGLAVRRHSDNSLSLANGQFIGVSLGRSLSDTEKTAVMRSGLRVPLRLTDESVAATKKIGDITFTAKATGTAGNSITIALVAGGVKGSEVVTVTGTAISVSMANNSSTTTEIVAKIVASAAANALVSCAIDEGDEAAAVAAASATALADGAAPYPYVAIGGVVKLAAASGLASSDGADSAAIYVSGAIDGVDPITGVESKVALVDMAGGL